MLPLLALLFELRIEERAAVVDIRALKDEVLIRHDIAQTMLSE